ncbi:hypothetical protein FOL47_011033, partial [Perkinsus chesapeaki]
MNLSSILSNHSDVLFEVGGFLTPTDLHRLAGSSHELYVTLSTPCSSQRASEEHPTSGESFLSGIVRSYGAPGICSSLGMATVPSDMESILALVDRRELPADLFYALLLDHWRELICWKDRRTGCSLLHLFVRYGGWRLIHLYAKYLIYMASSSPLRFGGDLDVPMEVQRRGTSTITFADPHENMPPIVSVPTSFIPVPLVMLGKTPLLHALRYYNTKEAEALVELGADVTIADEEERVPLTIAFRYSIRSPKLLLGLADPRILAMRDLYGWTPLHYAAFYDRHEQLSIILPNLAGSVEALKCVNNEGHTPIEVAIRE